MSEIEKSRRMVTIWAFVAVAVQLFIITYAVWQLSKHSDDPVPEKPMIELVNSARVTPLVKDECLTNLARVRAEYLIKNNYFDHYTPDGRTPWGFIEECGDYLYAGENLSTGISDNSELHVAFMNSPDHKKNIQSEKFNKFGFGCYKNICVEFFKN
jgi:uncharacterized protein YkwD